MALRPTTLTFLLSSEGPSLPSSTTAPLRVGARRVLLAQKLRGFGKGKWNGPGGKFEPSDVTVEQTAIRETMEEVCVTPLNLSLRGTLKFYFEGHVEWNTEVHVYTSSEWKGTPAATEEMDPQWFHEQDIPYEDMWEDDKIWYSSCHPPLPTAHS